MTALARPPNTALQRTRSAPLRSPLSFETLGGRRQLGGAAIIGGVLALAGCALGLPAYNEPFDERVRVISQSPAVFEIRIDGSDLPATQVPADGRAIVHIPVLPRECSTYLFGVRIKDRSVEARKVVEFLRDGRIVEKLSVNDLRGQRVDSAGFHELSLK